MRNDRQVNIKSLDELKCLLAEIRSSSIDYRGVKKHYETNIGIGNYLIGENFNKFLLNHAQLHVFCASHGIEKYKVSATNVAYVKSQFREAKKKQSIGALVAKSCGIKYRAWDCGIEYPTQDITRFPAMNDKEFLNAFNLGWGALNAKNKGVVALGELGACNTTIAAIVTSQILSIPIDEVIGRGSGINNDEFERKLQIANLALERANKKIIESVDILLELGGKEIVALVGVLARCAIERVPVILDGFVTCTAALFAVKILHIDIDIICPCKTQEPGQMVIANELSLNPFIALGHSSGDGVGAAVGYGFLRGSKRFQELFAATKNV